MKDESTLDSVGPVFIISSLALVMVVATWLMLRGGGTWGETPPPAPHAPVVAEAPSH